jgi:large conductance mechanosensitive channel
MLREFREFILRGNLVDLAVAVVIGTAFTAVVTSMVEDLITPLIAAIGGEPDFSALSFTIHESEFRYGDFINALIAFLIVSGVVFFFVIKPVNALLSRLRTEPPVAEETRQCPECLSDIPVAARRCAFCGDRLGSRLDRRLHLGPDRLVVEAREAPGRAGLGPGPRVRPGWHLGNEVEGTVAVPHGVDLGRKLREGLGAREVDREEPVVPRGAPEGAPPRVAGGDPDRDARTLHRARLELAVPVGQEAVEAVVEKLGARLGVALLAEAVGVELAGDAGAKADPEYEPPAAEAIEGDGLAGKLVGPSPRERGDEGADPEPLRAHGDGGERDPGIGERPDRLAVRDVVPEEEAVPPTPLGRARELGDEGGLGELLEWSDEDAASRMSRHHSLGIRIQRAM